MLVKAWNEHWCMAVASNGVRVQPVSASETHRQESCQASRLPNSDMIRSVDSDDSALYCADFQLEGEVATVECADNDTETGNVIFSSAVYICFYRTSILPPACMLDSLEHSTRLRHSRIMYQTLFLSHSANEKDITTN